MIRDVIDDVIDGVCVTHAVAHAYSQMYTDALPRYHVYLSVCGRNLSARPDEVTEGVVTCLLCLGDR